MIKIAFPDKKPQLRKAGDREHIFCMIRKRWVNLTPEEWVRQNFLLYMTESLKIPASLIAVEKQVIVGELKRRFDIVAYDKETRPLMIVECKEMNADLSEAVLNQALQYNSNIQARYLVITNGSYTMGFEKHSHGFIMITSFDI